jgi:NTE family protein
MFGRLVYTYRLLHNQLLDGLYVGASLELGRMRKPLVATNSTDLLTSGAVFIGADTPLGPFYLGFGAAADGNQSAYLFLGRP